MVKSSKIKTVSFKSWRDKYTRLKKNLNKPKLKRELRIYCMLSLKNEINNLFTLIAVYTFKQPEKKAWQHNNQCEGPHCYATVNE